MPLGLPFGPFFSWPQDPKICLTLWTFVLARFGVVAGGQFAGNEFRSIFTKATTVQGILCTMWFFSTHFQDPLTLFKYWGWLAINTFYIFEALWELVKDLQNSEFLSLLNIFSRYWWHECGTSDKIIITAILIMTIVVNTYWIFIMC